MLPSSGAALGSCAGWHTLEQHRGPSSSSLLPLVRSVHLTRKQLSVACTEPACRLPDTAAAACSYLTSPPALSLACPPPHTHALQGGGGPAGRRGAQGCGGAWAGQRAAARGRPGAGAAARSAASGGCIAFVRTAPPSCSRSCLLLSRHGSSLSCPQPPAATPPPCRSSSTTACRMPAATYCCPRARSTAARGGRSRLCWGGGGACCAAWSWASQVRRCWVQLGVCWGGVAWLACL